MINIESSYENVCSRVHKNDKMKKEGENGIGKKTCSHYILMPTSTSNWKLAVLERCSDFPQSVMKYTDDNMPQERRASWGHGRHPMKCMFAHALTKMLDWFVGDTPWSIWKRGHYAVKNFVERSWCIDIYFARNISQTMIDKNNFRATFIRQYTWRKIITSSVIEKNGTCRERKKKSRKNCECGNLSVSSIYVLATKYRRDETWLVWITFP